LARVSLTISNALNVDRLPLSILFKRVSCDFTVCDVLRRKLALTLDVIVDFLIIKTLNSKETERNIKMKERAVIVLSGKILDDPFSLDSLDDVRTAIERDLSDRNVTAIRRVATLVPQRYIAAPYFLQAGFETIPADDEDMQAAATLIATVSAPNPPDEIVFVLGVSEPIELLRLLAGRTRRVVLVQDARSELLTQNAERILNIREILSKEGIDWNSLDLKDWESWEREYDATLGNSDSSTSLENTDAQHDADLENLCQTAQTDVVEVATRTAKEWNAALIKLLMNANKKCSAFKATERLADDFPELPELYLHWRNDFTRLLSPEIRMTTDENQAGFLYHISHPEIERVSAADAVGLINIGGAVVEPTETENKRPTFVKSTSFNEIAARADTLRQQCEWQLDRDQLLASGASFEDSIRPRDLEIEALARDTSTLLWMRKQELDSTQTREAGVAYKLMNKTFALLARVADARDELEPRFVVDVMQLAADSQCMVKSMMSRFGVNINVDSVQRDAFELLAAFRETNYKTNVLANMKRYDLLDPSQYDSLFEKYAELNVRFDELRNKTKGLRNESGKLEYYVKKLKEKINSPSRENCVNEWNNLVRITTSLCEDYRIPYSSLRFRNLLQDVYDQIPDEIETTETYCRVVQSIEMEITREKEREEEEFRSVTPCFDEDYYSPEVETVRRRYDGAKAVFIGGVPQDHLRSRIESKLNVRLIWTETDHGDSLDRFGACLRDPDVKLFLIYIPWCSHKHSEEFAAYAKDADKDFVRLRKGTNPEIIAQAICKQLNLSTEGN